MVVFTPHLYTVWSLFGSSEIPITAPFPPVGENCAIMGISSLSAPTRSAELGAEGDRDFTLPAIDFHCLLHVGAK